MLTAIQFPFTDFRPFLQDPTNQLTTPAWDALDFSRDFVRSIGPIRERRKGSTLDWPTEDAFCRVSKAVRFEPSYHNVSSKSLERLDLRRYCAFRRFIADAIFKQQGSVVSRLEFGFGMRSRNRSRLSGKDCVECIISTLELPVRFHDGASPRTISFIETAELFDDLYLRSTTRRPAGQTSDAQSWWFRRGLPLAVAEYSLEDSRDTLPRQAKLVPALARHGIDLAFVKIEKHGIPIGIWLLGVRPGKRDPNLMRRLRINLMRLHAERQSIGDVLRLISQGKIPIVRNTDPTERLQSYLDKSMRLLNRQIRDGLPQSEILKISQEAEDFALTGEREKLLGKLEHVRGNLFRNLRTYLDTLAPISPAPVCRNKVFISYSHKDKRFLNELLTHLKPMERNLSPWSDTQIESGSQWLAEIRKALDSTKVAVLLVTRDFLASDFIHAHELGPLLKEAEAGGVSIQWILVRDCNWRKTPLASYQAAYPTEKPLAGMKGNRDSAWVAVCEKIETALAA